MGILLGSLFSDPRMAMGVFPVVYTPYIITGGFLSTDSILVFCLFNVFSKCSYKMDRIY